MSKVVVKIRPNPKGKPAAALTYEERRSILLETCISTINAMSGSSELDAARNRAEDVEILTPAIEAILNRKERNQA